MRSKGQVILFLNCDFFRFSSFGFSFSLLLPHFSASPFCFRPLLPTTPFSPTLSSPLPPYVLLPSSTPFLFSHPSTHLYLLLIQTINLTIHLQPFLDSISGAYFFNLVHIGDQAEFSRPLRYLDALLRYYYSSSGKSTLKISGSSWRGSGTHRGPIPPRDQKMCVLVYLSLLIPA